MNAATGKGEGTGRQPGQGLMSDVVGFMTQPVETRRLLRAWAISSAES